MGELIYGGERDGLLEANCVVLGNWKQYSNLNCDIKLIPPHSSMCQDFREAVRSTVGDQGEPALDDERLREILNELPDVYTLHRTILTELENRIQHWWAMGQHTLLLNRKYFNTHTPKTHQAIIEKKNPFQPFSSSIVLLRKQSKGSGYFSVMISPLFVHSGRTAKRLQIYSWAGKQSFWSLPPTSATTIGAWVYWRTAAEHRPLLRRLFNVLRYDLWQGLLTDLWKVAQNSKWHIVKINYKFKKKEKRKGVFENQMVFAVLSESWTAMITFSYYKDINR